MDALQTSSAETTPDTARATRGSAEVAMPTAPCTPAGAWEVLALQRAAGNRAVVAAVATGRLAVSRQPVRSSGPRCLARTPTKEFKTTDKDLDNLRAKMQLLAANLDYRTRMTLIGDKTLVIGRGRQRWRRPSRVHREQQLD
jgi:hypothetical protein